MWFLFVYSQSSFPFFTLWLMKLWLILLDPNWLQHPWPTPSQNLLAFGQSLVLKLGTGILPTYSSTCDPPYTLNTDAAYPMMQRRFSDCSWVKGHIGSKPFIKRTQNIIGESDTVAHVPSHSHSKKLTKGNLSPYRKYLENKDWTKFFTPPANKPKGLPYRPSYLWRIHDLSSTKCLRPCPKEWDAHCHINNSDQATNLPHICTSSNILVTIQWQCLLISSCGTVTILHAMIQQEFMQSNPDIQEHVELWCLPIIKVEICVHLAPRQRW